MQAAIARGEARRFPGGRKKKWHLARPWRFTSSEADQATVLSDRLDALVRGATMEPPPWQPHAGNSMETQALSSLEMTLVAKLNDRRAAMSLDEVEHAYAVIVQAELEIGGAGREARVERLRWERQQWLLRTSLPAGLERITDVRADQSGEPPALSCEPPGTRPLPAAPQGSSPDGATCADMGLRPPPYVCQLDQGANDPPVESEAELKDRELLEAYSFAMKVIEAGRNAGSRLAGVRVEPEPPCRRSGSRTRHDI
jgi:hypothetical protein